MRSWKTRLSRFFVEYRLSWLIDLRVCSTIRCAGVQSANPSEFREGNRVQLVTDSIEDAGEARHFVPRRPTKHIPFGGLCGLDLPLC